MRFSKLRLSGFKSFVDPTELIISEGLTGVVGPNGCGKSNLLEALRWVMGENRPSAMRGSGMEDVIFAGSSRRPARSHAEVCLTLDNTDRRAPVAFNSDDKLDVIRKITRDIGSAYRINGKDARARDVQMLFADASTGSHSPSLVRQGQISELINAKPKARRRVLEEAAGISGLYQRRHEAELKLRNAESNLERLSDLLASLSTQLASLERQARQAARYRVIAEELRQVEGQRLLGQWQAAKHKRDHISDEMREATQSTARAERIVLELTRSRDALLEAVPPAREAEAIAGAIVQRMTLERGQYDERLAHAQSEIDRLSRRQDQLAKDSAREEALNADASQMIARLNEEDAALTAAASGAGDILANARAAADIARKKALDQEMHLGTRTDALARVTAQHQALERRKNDARTIAQKRKSEQQSTQSSALDLRHRATELSAKRDSVEKEVAAAERALSAAETRLMRAEESREAIQAREAEARAALASQTAELRAFEAEIAALTRLIEREKINGARLLDQIDVDAGYEAAFGAALNEDLAYPDEEAAPQGSSAWLTLPPLSAPSLPTGARPLADFVRSPKALSRRISHCGIIARNDGPTAQKELSAGQCLVSKEGHLWRWDGLSLTAEDTLSQAAQILAQKNKLSVLQSQHAEHQTAHQAATEAYDRLKADVAHAQQEERSARDERKNAERHAAELTRQKLKEDGELARVSAQLEALSLTMARIEDDLRIAAASLKEAEEEADQLDDPLALQRSIETERQALTQLRKAADEQHAQAEFHARAIKGRARRQDEIAKELRSWQSRLGSAGERMTELRQLREETKSALVEAQAQPAQLSAAREALKTQLEKEERRQKEAGDALAEAESALQDGEAALRNAERQAGQNREARAAIQARLDAAQSALESALEAMLSTCEMMPKELAEALGLSLDAPLDLARITREQESLSKARDALGAVNLRAEEDARSLLEERDALAKECDDLTGAITKLRQGIQELNKEGRSRLLAAFDEVNQNFTLLFTHLFGGGEANLVLVESDDPLDAGLEIMCQPPGKKLATLSLLSGGEQTLTALSLIFAVFLANPSPICVLDEVDAPLDDANVTRFCNLLDEMTRRTQTRFLIITHHALTMSRMDRLFGVTMAEAGVSQLVSVNLNEAAALVA